MVSTGSPGVENPWRKILSSFFSWCLNILNHFRIINFIILWKSWEKKIICLRKCGKLGSSIALSFLLLQEPTVTNKKWHEKNKRTTLHLLCVFSIRSHLFVNYLLKLSIWITIFLLMCFRPVFFLVHLLSESHFFFLKIPRNSLSAL